MDFKGQQHSDVMRFFFKLTADFQKNFLHFVKGNSIVFLERMKNQKAKLDLLSKLDEEGLFYHRNVLSPHICANLNQSTEPGWWVKWLSWNSTTLLCSLKRCLNNDRICLGASQVPYDPWKPLGSFTSQTCACPSRNGAALEPSGTQHRDGNTAPKTSTPASVQYNFQFAFWESWW